jgi:hypothetical protein
MRRWSSGRPIERLRTMSSSLSVVGLFYVVVGALLLAKAFLNSDRRIEILARPYWDLGVPLVRLYVEQRIDGRFGLTLLAVGLSLQAAVWFGGDLPHFFSLLIALAVIPVVIWYRTNRDCWVVRAVFRICQRVMPKEWEFDIAAMRQFSPDIPGDLIVEADAQAVMSRERGDEARRARARGRDVETATARSPCAWTVGTEEPLRPSHS